MTMTRLALAAALLIAACDSHATESNAKGATSRTEERSHEYESCSSSAQCQDGSRCFDLQCRRMARSLLGDYYAMRGADAGAHGDLETAISSYATALKQYESDKIDLPPDVDCGYGATLAASKANRERAELAARVLHRCVLATPVGSQLHTDALVDAASLEDAGFDPTLLLKTTPADIYLTKKPTAPAHEAALKVVANPPPTAKSFPVLLAKLDDPELHKSLLACWSASAAAVVTLGVTAKYQDTGYDDEPGRFVVSLDAPATGASAVDACVRAALTPVFKKLDGIKDAFTTQLTFQAQ